ncbi:quinolinate synthase A [Terasakiella brassicae]|uniref:Quinolinate synthase n=1 Tax=Terasakiella brassicae TaxID=1634917 RepID=A0A917F8M5_9PROT|nr:quinolinate synthase NadA [Terasakiella brassicae]GGF58113.1 quinolinate synthase A [Terasakiella brassicae]
MTAVAQRVNDDFEYSADVAARMAPVYERVKDHITAEEWPVIAPYVDEILRLKKERNAVILAHNYQTRDIFHCVSDIVGDSLALAVKAKEVDADVMVVCGVHFMAETAKLLNPSKKVLIPDPEAGCSLAESITGADVRKLKADNPGVPVCTYVNTSAEVKAEVDICCTSANAKKIVESLGSDKVLLIPDEFLAQNVAKTTDVEILTWAGRCEVHELYKKEDIEQIKKDHPECVVLAHPECPPDVLDAADFSGSTTGMADFVKEKKPELVALITECSMSDNIRADCPDSEFIMSCSMCPHMKKITLQKIVDCLRDLSNEVHVDEAMAEPARASIEAMIAAS